MDALDVISLESAKAELAIDYPDRDAEVTRLIKTAIALVEQYTDYRLYQRNETFVTSCYKTDIVVYPMDITSVTKDGDVVAYKEYAKVLSTELYTEAQSEVALTVGYDDVIEIPEPLIDAAYKMIVYLADNKDIYSVSLPIDVQLMINKYRRSATI